MTNDISILGVGFGGFTIFFALFSILNRKRETYPIHNILFSFTPTLLVTLILSFRYIHVISYELIAVFLYCLLVSVYIFAVYLNIDSSLHVRIFREMAKRASRGLTYSELLHSYNKQIILQKRLEWLLNSGEIGIRSSIYFPRRRFSLLILREKFLLILGKLYGSEGEFNILLLFILLGALLVRVWGINFGLPDKHYIDEQHLIYWAFYSGSHWLRPVYYLYAPLIPMILLIEFSFYFISGYILGVFSTPLQFFISYLSDPTPFFLIGRVTMAVVGVATVWLVYTVGKTFFNNRVGLIASFFLAFTFLHVKESHYIKQDVVTGFFVLAAIYFTLNILEKARLRDYILGGVMGALAFGAKYQAIIILPLIFTAHVISTKTILSKKLILLGLAFLITFSLIHPYLIFEPKVTIEQTLPFVVSNVSLVYPEHLQGKPIWWWFMFEHIPLGIGYPIFIAAIAGFTLCLLKTKTKKQFIFIPLLPLLFFISIDRLTSMHFARYAVMLLPYFILSAAIVIDFLVSKMKYSGVLTIVLVIVFIAPSFIRIVQFNSLLIISDTRTLAKEWFEQVVPPGSKVLVESTVKPEYPSNLNVSLALDGKSVEKRIREAENREQEALYLRALREANRDKIGYDVIATTHVWGVTDENTDEFTRLQNVNYYVDNSVSYIVLTGWVQEPMSPEFEFSLNTYYTLVKEFKPTYEFKYDPHLIRMDYATLDNVNIFRTDLVFGPTISVYKLKSQT